ncbi:MAG: hypothetical protein BM557_10800 [Flavobacterium sp. MedPE-SWcel]|uniref:FecR family protein n=1 Tax=uncultured Flavobacterium sp. TaxID=165435 RepID=UPI00091D9AAA|nr:FecR domain-containing protein [uncultured Flavobacterium sp.]OIQ15784.1 MAG: hypothetical protein BM557_10800 [Flavobacterium sp. MedPE-SWcel]
MKEDIKLAKWLDGKMDEKELQEFEALPGFETYRKIKEYSGAFTAPEADTDTIYQNITRNKNRKNKVVKLTPWFSKIAAALIVMLGTAYFFYATHTTNEIAVAGEHTEFLLPDNSSVVLNAGSEAEFRAWNWDSNRKVELYGEAYFKVAKGQKFDVVTTLGKVTVMGTEFNVKARGNRFDVVCFEGKVKVTSNNTETILTPGKSVSLENGKSITTPKEKGIEPSWINYEVHYHDERLANVIAEMERQYNITINLPKEKGDSEFNGPLPMNNLDIALENITTLYNLKVVKKDGDKIILATE